MAMIFHEADDSCAPFPHRVMVKPARTVPLKREKTLVFTEQVYIFCAQCDHWILTRVRCDCSYKCHELGELLASLVDTASQVR